MILGGEEGRGRGGREAWQAAARPYRPSAPCITIHDERFDPFSPCFFPSPFFFLQLDEHMDDDLLLAFFNRNNLQNTTIVPNNNKCVVGAPQCARPPLERACHKIPCSLARSRCVANCFTAPHALHLVLKKRKTRGETTRTASRAPAPTSLQRAVDLARPMPLPCAALLLQRPTVFLQHQKGRRAGGSVHGAPRPRQGVSVQPHGLRPRHAAEQHASLRGGRPAPRKWHRTAVPWAFA